MFIVSLCSVSPVSYVLQVAFNFARELQESTRFGFSKVIGDTTDSDSK